MKLIFENLNPIYKHGMTDFLNLHKISLSDNGLKVTVSVNPQVCIRITKNKENVLFEVDEEYQIFRCITLLKNRIDEECFVIEETRHFDTCGAMFDGSQASSLMTVASIKKMLLYMAGMGYNMAMLYCEDCYELEGEPYWKMFCHSFSTPYPI